MKSIILLLLICFSTTAAVQAQKAPPEEELRKWWIFKPGTEIMLLKPDYSPNWCTEMNSFAGKDAKVTELLGRDSDGYYMVKVDADKGYFSWRVRNIADLHSKAAGVLSPILVSGTDIPLCVVPRSSSIQLYKTADDTTPIGKVPALESTDAAGHRRILPRYLYVHAYSNNYLEVMESDLSSRKTLGWIKRDDAHQWNTRQGYIINYARSAKSKRNLARGYGEMKNIGRPGKEVFVENIRRARNTDPNMLGMPDGLLVGKNSEAYKGLDVVRCAFMKPGDNDLSMMYLPVRTSFSPATDTIIPVALLSKTELQELEAMAHMLFAACDAGAGRIDAIREALTKNWDMTSKVVVGTERRNLQYAKQYKRLQNLFPALTRGLQLPPGEAPEKTFKAIGSRAENIANNAARILAKMRREKRDWVWINLSELY